MRFFDRKRELADLEEIRGRSEEVAQFTVVWIERYAFEVVAYSLKLLGDPSPLQYEFPG